MLPCAPAAPPPSSTHLHEVPGHQRLADVGVVVAGGEVGGHQADLEAGADAHELRAHVVGRLEGAVVEEIRVAPLVVLACR